MREEMYFQAVSEAELNEILSGKMVGPTLPWPSTVHHRWMPGQFGVLFGRARRGKEPIPPVALVVREEDQRRLFSRVAQLRSDLSPLSVWCHILTPAAFAAIDSPAREANLGDFTAAWSGLVVAEALLLAERSVGKLRIAACLATQSFAVARAFSLWANYSRADILEGYDFAHSIFRSGELRIQRLRSALLGIWSALQMAGLGGNTKVSDFESSTLSAAIALLSEQRATASGDGEEGYHLANILGQIAIEAEILRSINNLTPEQRVREFDKIIQTLDREPRDAGTIRSRVLCFIAAYIATVAAGGAASLPMVEAIGAKWPEVFAWAYVIGGIGERVFWVAGFDGLGRLVARELRRPFRLDDAPVCDFAIEEAASIIDSQLSDPLVHLRIKQSRIATARGC